MEKTLLVNDAAEVRKTIARYMLADAMDLVFDLEKSHGSRLYDAKSGRFFLDFFGCYATIAIGYNHPHLTSPAALRTLAHASVQKPSNSDVYTREMADFVETFGRVAKPDFMKYLFFIEGGALAVENALKAAFDWKVRKNFAKGIEQEKGYKVIHFRQAFHGRSGYTMSLTNTFDPRKTQYFPKFDWPRVTNPKCAFPLEGENLRKVELLEREAFAQIEESIQRDPADVSCILLEPIQAEGGDNYFRPEFHRALRRICDENELLLIHDEVQTGFGVTGKMWACEHYVKPDLIAFGKKSQVCGVIAGERLDEVAENVFHVSSRINSTWGGNLVDMVRCRLNLEVYEQEGLLDYAARVGALLLGELRALERDFAGKVSNARGLGLFCAFDLASREMRDQFRRSCFENQLIILGCGERTVRFRTALNIPESDLAQGIDIVRKVLRGL